MNDPILSFDVLYDAREESARILRLQRMLRTISHVQKDEALNTAENGIYDDATRAAVIAFQQKNDLAVTGRVNGRTWKLLREQWAICEEARREPAAIRPFTPVGRVITTGEHSDLVVILQLMLNALRLHIDSIPYVPLSGHYDETTAEAVRAFQRVSLLPVTGEVDASVWNRLAADYNRMAAESQ